jgi:hypothetical protein
MLGMEMNLLYTLWWIGLFFPYFFDVAVSLKILNKRILLDGGDGDSSDSSLRVNRFCSSSVFLRKGATILKFYVVPKHLISYRGNI